MAKSKAKLPEWATDEACNLIQDILNGIEGATVYWFRTDTKQDDINQGYNEGLAAAEQIVVKALRKHGFTVRRLRN
jgi:hypothetical protein